jgi:membrane fusion protein, multidrug efflux system
VSRRALVIGTLVALAAAGGAYATRDRWGPQVAGWQGPGAEILGPLLASIGQTQAAPSAPAPRAAPPARVVDVAAAVKKPAPVVIEALGTVMPIESVAIRSRVDSAITAVHFADGAAVNKGDLLFTLDSRTIEAQIRAASGTVARDRAQLEGAERDVRRYAELVEKNATPVINLDNARTQVDTFRANLAADEGTLENLRVQLSYCTIRAPIAGRIGAAGAKVGNVVRASDTPVLATINQMSPIYVTFSVPQRVLPEVRQALAAEGGEVEAVIAGQARSAKGRLAMVDNAVDQATGMVSMRAVMQNSEEILWPGALVNARLTLRVEDAVVVPATAVQTGQSGKYVFIIKDNVATVRPVSVARSDKQDAVIASGIEPGESVVTYGQLQLTNGTKVTPRDAKVGS